MVTDNPERKVPALSDEETQNMRERIVAAGRKAAEEHAGKVPPEKPDGVIHDPAWQDAAADFAE